MRRGIQSQVGNLSAIQQAMSGDVKWKDILDRGYVIAGSPQTVVDRIDEATDALRVGHLMVLLQFGDMPKEKTYENTQRFATEVMPKLRDKWSEWEDRWFPTQSLTPPARPAPVGDARNADRGATA